MIGDSCADKSLECVHESLSGDVQANAPSLPSLVADRPCARYTCMPTWGEVFWKDAGQPNGPAKQG